MQQFKYEAISAEDFDRQKALYTPFTDAVRDLLDATIRTEGGAEEIRRAQSEIEAITAR